MATAKKLKSGNWRVQVYAGKDPNGKRKYKSFTAETERKANLMALEWQEHYRQIVNDSSNLTLKEAVDNYISIKSNVLSPATIRSYHSIISNHLKGIRDLKISKLTQTKIQEAINIEAAEHSPKTVKNIYGLVSVVTAYYAPDIKLGHITLPQLKRPQNVSLNRNQIAILLNNIEEDPIEIPVLLALWLGLRRSEILALKWDDIDFDAMTLRVDEALVPDKDNNMVLKSTKTTDSERTLQLPKYIALKMQNLPKEGERLFNIKDSALSKGFPKLCERIGLPRFKFHDLRRSMATIGLSLNIADKIVMQRGGWNNVQTMKKIYQIVLQDDANSAENAFNNFFYDIMQHEKQHKN